MQKRPISDPTTQSQPATPPSGGIVGFVSASVGATGDSDFSSPGSISRSDVSRGTPFDENDMAIQAT